MILLIFFTVFWWLILYGLARKVFKEQELEIKALKLEIEKARNDFFNEVLSSNMKEEVVVKKPYVDNDPSPVKWIKRDIEN